LISSLATTSTKSRSHSPLLPPPNPTRASDSAN
jgi:hypothetical protein